MNLNWTNIEKEDSIGHTIFEELRTNISSLADFLDSSGGVKRELILPNNALLGKRYSKFNSQGAIYSDVETLDSKSKCMGNKVTHHTTVYTSCNHYTASANSSHCPSNYSSHLGTHNTSYLNANKSSVRSSHDGSYNGSQYGYR